MKKIFTSFFLSVACVLAAFAQTTVTFDSSVEGWSGTAGEQTATLNGVTLATSNGLLASSGEYRFYKNQTCTISSTAGNITKVEFTCTKEGDAQYGPGCFALTSGGGTYTYDGAVGTWTGETAELVLTASSNQVRATVINVTIGGEPAQTIDVPTFSVTETTFSEPQELVITAAEGYGLIYTLDGTKPEEGNGTFVAAGTATITLTETTTVKAVSVDNDDPDRTSAVKTVTYTYVQSTFDHITIAEFLAKADTKTAYELTGVVKNITSTKYGNFDLHEGSDSIYIYGLLDLDGKKQNFESLGIVEGDTVTLTGVYMEYNGKPEISNAQYVSHKSGKHDPKPKMTQITMAEFVNGTMEDWTDGALAQWNPLTTAGGATLEQSTDAHSGSYSVLVKGATSNKRIASTEIALEAGSYAMIINAKAVTETAQARPGYAVISLNADSTAYLTLSGDSYKYFDVAEEVGQEWTEIKHIFTLEEPTIISLIVMNPKNAGDLLLDDVVLRAATEEETAINSIGAVPAAMSSAIYNLAGQRILTPQRGTIYIQNGKKYIK